MPSKVLIVDDDKTTREGLAEFLEEAGYEAVAVGTFEDATRVLRTSPPDLLIADVRLGPFNGLQLVISSPQPIPAIIITGFAAAAPTTSSSRCRRHGCSTSSRRNSRLPAPHSAYHVGGNASP